MGNGRTAVGALWPRQRIIPHEAATRRRLAAALGAVLLGCAMARAVPAPPQSPLVASTAVGSAPSALAVDPRSGHVFVANSADNTVTVLDARTGRVLRTSAVGTYPDQVGVNPRTERVFVSNRGDGSVSVLDARTGALQRTLRPAQGPEPAVEYPHAAIFVFDGVIVGGTSSVSDPTTAALVIVQDTPRETRLQVITSPPPGWWGLAVDGPAGRLVVPDMADGSVDLFDAGYRQYLHAVSVGANPVAVAVDPATRRAFVASLGPLPPAQPASTVSTLVLPSGRVLATVAVGPSPAVLTVDGPAGRVLVVHGWGGPTGADQGRTRGETDVLDARSGRVLATLAVGAVTPESLALAAHLPLVAVDERRSHAVVLETAAGRVRVLDDRRPRVLRTVAVAPFPIAVAVDAPAARLFVLHRDADCHTRSSSAWALVPASMRRWLPFLASPGPPPGIPELTCANHGSVSVFDLARL